jgi:hypothetical protein
MPPKAATNRGTSGELGLREDLAFGGGRSATASRRRVPVSPIDPDDARSFGTG